jgi:peroxiredoxin
MNLTRRHLARALALPAAAMALGAPLALLSVADAMAKVPAPAAVGEHLAIPTLTTIAGHRITAADLRGKFVIIEYWASWCPFCQKQLPYFEKLYRARKDDGLVVIGLNIEHDTAKAANFAATRSLSFPVVMANAAIDRALKRPKGLPVTYVIGRDGVLKQLEKSELFEEDVADIGAMIGASPK